MQRTKPLGYFGLSLCLFGLFGQLVSLPFLTTGSNVLVTSGVLIVFVSSQSIRSSVLLDNKALRRFLKAFLFLLVVTVSATILYAWLNHKCLAW